MLKKLLLALAGLTMLAYSAPASALILMACPAPNTNYSLSTGSVYVSDAQSLVKIFNNSTSDQSALNTLGCNTLSPFGPLGSLGYGLLSDLYTYDTANHLTKYSVATVFNDSGNNGTWYKTGTGNGSGNWTQGSTLTITQLNTNLGTETTNRTNGDASLTSSLSTETTNRTNADTALQTQVTANLFAFSSGTAVDAATTGGLSGVTYSNGTAGVGATLTAGSNGALPAQDGQTLTVNSRLLVMDQGTRAWNGVYSVTQIGDASHPYILTRVTDMDSASEIAGVVFKVNAGTAKGGNYYYCPIAAGAVTIGTSQILYMQLAQ